MTSYNFNKRREELDLLRTISIILIMLNHAPEYIHNSSVIDVFSPYVAYLGLGLFVFLSGYLTYYKNPTVESLSDIVTFYKKRIKRIYTLYWIALTIFILVFWIIFLLSGYEPLIDLSYFSLIIHLFGAQILLAPRYVTPFFTLWFIGLILMYYFMYPFLIRYSKNTQILFCYSVLSFILLYAVHILFNIIEMRFFIYYFPFICGIITASKDISLNRKHEKYYSIFIVLFFCSLILSTKIGTNLSDLKSIIFIEIVIISFAFTQFFIAKKFINLFSLNEKHLFTFVSTASYCIYLFHRPILFMFSHIFDLLSNQIYSDILMIFIAYPILFIVSYYIQVFEFSYNPLRDNNKYAKIKLNFDNLGTRK